MTSTRRRGGFTFSATIDRADFRALVGGLNRLDKTTQDELRDTSEKLAGGLVRQLRETAVHAPTPAASIVAQSARAKRDRLVTVEVGGPRKVGRPYRTRERTKSGKRSSKKIAAAAGTLVWGTETGSRRGTDSRGRAYTNRFGAPGLPHDDGAGYWIEPAMRRFLPAARDAWVETVVGMLRREGFRVTYGG